MLVRQAFITVFCRRARLHGYGARKITTCPTFFFFLTGCVNRDIQTWIWSINFPLFLTIMVMNFWRTQRFIVEDLGEWAIMLSLTCHHPKTRIILFLYCWVVVQMARMLGCVRDKSPYLHLEFYVHTLYVLCSLLGITRDNEKLWMLLLTASTKH